jgi:hypothetical protein
MLTGQPFPVLTAPSLSSVPPHCIDDNIESESFLLYYIVLCELRSNPKPDGKGGKRLLEGQASSSFSSSIHIVCVCGGEA